MHPGSTHAHDDTYDQRKWIPCAVVGRRSAHRTAPTRHPDPRATTPTRRSRHPPHPPPDATRHPAMDTAPGGGARGGPHARTTARSSRSVGWARRMTPPRHGSHCIRLREPCEAERVSPTPNEKRSAGRGRPSACCGSCQPRPAQRSAPEGPLLPKKVKCALSRLQRSSVIAWLIA